MQLELVLVLAIEEISKKKESRIVMRHRILTCKNHLDLRWTCKEIAWTGLYNGERGIHFKGSPTGKGMYEDGSGLDCSKVIDNKLVWECDCPTADLILAKEDSLVVI